MKEILLTQGKVAIIDDDDFENVSKYKWYANISKSKYISRWYAYRNIKANDRWTIISIHSFIMNTFQEKQIDHKNGNGLDNRKENLRICTQAQNCANKPKAHKFSCKYKGVRWTKGKYEANIQYQKKARYIGRFENEIEAAIAYDIQATVLYGEFAILNFPTINKINELVGRAAWEAWKYGRQLSAEMTTSPAFEAWYEQFKSK